MIFRAAEDALGLDAGAGGRILHVGDDWAADVVGAHDAGWRIAYLRDRQGDTPLPTSQPGDHLGSGAKIVPDLVIDELSDLDASVELAEATGAPA
jgi:FMN phosphatase YigB (HAD superfamily)